MGVARGMGLAKDDTGETPAECVRTIISEAMYAVAMDGFNPAVMEKWLHQQLKPYLVKAAR